MMKIFLNRDSDVTLRKFSHHDTLVGMWNKFWLRQCPPHLIAILRIVFGSYLLLYWGLRFLDIRMLFSGDGLLLPKFGLEPPSFEAAYALYVALLIALVLFTIGFRMRISGLIAVAINLYFWFLSLHTFGTSYDRLYIVLLLVLSFSGADKAYSLRMYLRHGSFFAHEHISILAQRLIAVQITATYLGVGWQKFVLPDWSSGGGEILAWGFMGLWASPLAWKIAQMNLPMWVYDGLVQIVMGFEFFLPIGLWTAKTRWWFFLGTAIFHLSIASLLSIPWFLILIPANIVFLPPEQVSTWLKRRFEGGRSITT